MSKEVKQETKKTAGQRIENLEKTLQGTLKALSEMSNEQSVLKEALSLLGAKLDAVVQLLRSQGDLSDRSISNVMTENKAVKMAKDVESLEKNGILVKQETVDDNSFLVCREVLADGTVLSPRTQFAAEAAKPLLKAKILGAKVLDKILVEEGKATLEVMEIYSIVQPKAPPQQPVANA